MKKYSNNFKKHSIFCFDCITITISLLLIVFLFVAVYHFSKKSNFYQYEKNIKNDSSSSSSSSWTNNYYQQSQNPLIFPNFLEKPAFAGGNVGPSPNNDVYLNPYVPPIKDESYLYPQLNYFSRKPFIEYRQIGILTPTQEQNGNDNNKKLILPIFGRPVYSNRDKFQYYTMSNANNSVKLSVYRFKKNCMKDVGCNEIFSGDTVYVDGYKSHFIATIYEND